MPGTVLGAGTQLWARVPSGDKPVGLLNSCSPVVSVTNTATLK